MAAFLHSVPRTGAGHGQERPLCRALGGKGLGVSHSETSENVTSQSLDLGAWQLVKTPSREGKLREGGVPNVCCRHHMPGHTHRP